MTIIYPSHWITRFHNEPSPRCKHEFVIPGRIERVELAIYLMFKQNRPKITYINGYYNDLIEINVQDSDKKCHFVISASDCSSMKNWASFHSNKDPLCEHTTMCIEEVYYDGKEVYNRNVNWKHTINGGVLEQFNNYFMTELNKNLDLIPFYRRKIITNPEDSMQIVHVVNKTDSLDCIGTYELRRIGSNLLEEYQRRKFFENDTIVYAFRNSGIESKIIINKNVTLY